VEGHFFFNASDLKVAADEQRRGRLKLENRRVKTHVLVETRG
jgi:hypothetical protein